MFSAPMTSARATNDRPRAEEEQAVEYRVLGPIEVVGDDGERRVVRGRQLTLLAFLVANRNRTVLCIAKARVRNSALGLT